MSIRLLVSIAILSFTACSGAPSAVAEEEETSERRFEAFVLGNMQDGGLPHLGCTAECCVEARREGRVGYPASLGIHDRNSGKLVLVEATPAIEAQVSKLHELSGVSRKGQPPVDAILLTHAHIGHYTGLVHLGREVASTKELPVYVSKRMAEYLTNNGPWSQLVQLGQISLRTFEYEEPFEPIPGLRVEAIQVPHRDEYSDTVAFKLRSAEKAVLFVPDMDQWDRQRGIEFKLLEEVHYAYMDGTFYDGRELPGRDLSEIPHPPMMVTMKKLAVVAKSRPGFMRFIHMNHTNPVLRDEALERDVEARGYRVAQQFERQRF